MMPPTMRSSRMTSFCTPADGVVQHDFLGLAAADEIAGGEEIHAGDLQLGRQDRALVAADTEMRQVVGAHLAHLEQRRHQAVGHAAVRHALAHRVDLGS